MCLAGDDAVPLRTVIAMRNDTHSYAFRVCDPSCMISCRKPFKNNDAMIARPVDPVVA